jgi:hypothetical protein
MLLMGPGLALVPGVQLGLQAVTLFQQRGIFGGQIGHDGVKASPEGIAANACAGQHLVVDEVKQLGGHLQAVNLGACSHVDSPLDVEKLGEGRADRALRQLSLRLYCKPKAPLICNKANDW